MTSTFLKRNNLETTLYDLAVGHKTLPTVLVRNRSLISYY